MTKVEERPLSTPMPPNIASPMLILLQRLHLFGQRQPAVFGSGFFLAQHFEFFCQRGEAGVVAGEEAAVGEFGSDGRHFRLDLVDAAGEAVVVTLVLVAEFLALLRSEEHTSELQSLMITSYTDLFLKKKK